MRWPGILPKMLDVNYVSPDMFAYFALNDDKGNRKYYENEIYPASAKGRINQIFHQNSTRCFIRQC